MSSPALLSRPRLEVADTGWVEMDEVHADVYLVDASSDANEAFTELEPAVVAYESQQAMRFGPRSYTPAQAEVIKLAVQERKPLRVAPLPLDE
jgi:hypothetical protein